ncbi:MAG: signal peptidase I [Faecousia sp.]
MAKTKKPLAIEQVIRKRGNQLLIRQGYVSLLLRCIVLIVVLVILFSQVFLITQVSGNDMFPAIKDGDLVFAYRLQKDLSKNDVIVYRYNGELRVGRILGRPGDVIMMDESGTLLVNGTAQGGEIMYPTYAKENYTYPYVVPEDSYFILGDYRTQTEDSRDFGPVVLSSIQGKVITILRRRGI